MILLTLKTPASAGIGREERRALAMGLFTLAVSNMQRTGFLMKYLRAKSLKDFLFAIPATTGAALTLLIFFQERPKKTVPTHVRKVWAMHLQNIDTGTISRSLKVNRASVSNLAQGRGWMHLSGAPTLSELKAGGVRRGVIFKPLS